MKNNALWFAGLALDEYMLYSYYTADPSQVYLYYAIGRNIREAIDYVDAIRRSYEAEMQTYDPLRSMPRMMVCGAPVQAMLAWDAVTFHEWEDRP